MEKLFNKITYVGTTFERNLYTNTVADMKEGSFWYDTDTHEMYMWNGMAWAEVGLDIVVPDLDDVTFEGLSDGPGSFAGNAGKLVAVKAGEAELEYIDNTAFIGARYSSNAGQNIVNNATIAIINFEDKIYDDDLLVTTGAEWKFTAPSAGYYHIDCCVMFAASSNWAVGDRGIIVLYVDNVALITLDRRDNQSGGSTFMLLLGNATIKLAAGSYIDVRIAQNSGADLALNANDPNSVWINIEKIGSYTELA